MHAGCSRVFNLKYLTSYLSSIQIGIETSLNLGGTFGGNTDCSEGRNWSNSCFSWSILYICFVVSYSVFFLFFLFLGPHLQHIEAPRQGVKSELQLEPTPQSKRQQIWGASASYTEHTERGQGLNPHSQGHYVGFLTHWATTGTSIFLCFRTLPTVFSSGCTDLHSYQQCS